MDQSVQKIRVLFLCEDPGGRDRARAFERILGPQGVVVTYIPFDVTLRSWLKTVAVSDVIVVLFYGDYSDRIGVYLAYAAARGVPISRWWVGGDVWDCITSPRIRSRSLKLNRIVSTNVAVASHLTVELAELGFEAKTINSSFSMKVDGLTPSATSHTKLPKGVLIYLPTAQFKFYGGEVARCVIRANSDLTFLIVGGCDARAFEGLRNVRCLGWVNDMARLYDEVGCVLRVTEHDGLPRTVLEALWRGRYVIYSFPIEGCWLARTEEEVHEKLRQFRVAKGPNVEGMAAMTRLFEPDPAKLWVATLYGATRDNQRLTRFTALRTLVRLCVRCVKSKCVPRWFSSNDARFGPVRSMADETGYGH